MRERNGHDKSGGNIPVKNFHRAARPLVSKKIVGSIPALRQLSTNTKINRAAKRYGK
jgi:hypothetical protein